jgi:aminoglycoside 6'-N-acetyltransferase
VTELRGERVVLRHATAANVDAIAAVIAEPEVARWWGEHDTAQGLIDDPTVETFAIEVGGEVAGVLLVTEESDPEYRHAALDISLATRFQDQGLGREALRLVIDHLAEERGHHRFTIDPAADNERAIRCYRAVGFKPVGVLRRYWRDPAGVWRDGLLMDLLADERL